MLDHIRSCWMGSLISFNKSKIFKQSMNGRFDWVALSLDMVCDCRMVPLDMEELEGDV